MAEYVPPFVSMNVQRSSEVTLMTSGMENEEGARFLRGASGMTVIAPNVTGTAGMSAPVISTGLQPLPLSSAMVLHMKPT